MSILNNDELADSLEQIIPQIQRDEVVALRHALKQWEDK